MIPADVSGTRFNVHGKCLIQPLQTTFKDEPALSNTIPGSILASRARVLIDTFIASGCSQHSRRGSTLWVLVEYCITKGLRYDITGTPSEGYCIELLGEELDAA